MIQYEACMNILRRGITEDNRPRKATTKYNVFCCKNNVLGQAQSHLLDNKKSAVEHCNVEFVVHVVGSNNVSLSPLFTADD